MNELNYEEVPNIISGKDLDYLSDMFNWNYGAYKSSVNAISSVNDGEIKNVLEKCANIFHNTMNDILSIINSGGNNE